MYNAGILHFIVSSIGCILGVCGNSLVILRVIRFSWLKTPTTVFVAALAFYDLLLGFPVP